MFLMSPKIRMLIASALGVGMAAVQNASEVINHTSPRATKRTPAAGSALGVNSYPAGPRWTHAQVQRMARKRRNVQANRRAQKRAGR